ncbi:MAG: hypothetical protein R3268_08340 [Acidiferrobacterales bacterium]|nr:hypothetical protein [Acidiferrobacterales bacterium]
MTRILFLALCAVLVGCASGAGPSTYDQLYAQAQSEVKTAKRMGFIWRDTELLLEQSGKAWEQGDKRRAKQLAQEALEQARLAQQQARDQANVAPVYPPN